MKQSRIFALKLCLLFLTAEAQWAAEDASMEEFRNALIGHTWSYEAGPRSISVQFRPDGTAAFSDGRTNSWVIAASRTVHIGESITLNFNESLTGFEGFNHHLKRKIHGNRIESSPSPAPAPAASPTPTPLPAQPPSASATAAQAFAARSDTLGELAANGPYITDQVLAPLDVNSVPEAAVTLWKEDLLDEAAKAPASAQASYRLAAGLLEAWKGALRERYQTISNSEFAGAIVDTPDMSSSRKTTLHIWDWLQYARERDDAARHEVAKQRTADFFASGPARRWAERSAILRKNIEAIYTAFRQSLRVSPTPAASH